jgi:hypothetical protein
MIYNDKLYNILFKFNTLYLMCVSIDISSELCSTNLAVCIKYGVH